MSKKNYVLDIPLEMYESEIYDPLWDIYTAAAALCTLDISALPDIANMKTFVRQMAEIIEARYDRLYAVLGDPGDDKHSEYPGKVLPAQNVGAIKRRAIGRKMGKAA